uniref:Uncharacterized protein n=1 Tax=Mycolicibacterium gilvum (strain PYR-GCK) TaxID=350054 RepID=A4T233_MYCGI|nr:hypothetical protein Mflv_2795 [Mycolicibacterium gilvum PYR-GCK]
MPYYLTPVAELPYPHTMGEWPLQDGTRSNCPHGLEAVLRARSQHPGQDGYRELFTDDTISARRQACDVHAGNWTVVLPESRHSSKPFRRVPKPPPSPTPRATTRRSLRRTAD